MLQNEGVANEFILLSALFLQILVFRNVFKGNILTAFDTMLCIC